MFIMTESGDFWRSIIVHCLPDNPGRGEGGEARIKNLNTNSRLSVTNFQGIDIRIA